MTDSEFLRSSVVRWEVMFNASSRHQAEVIQSVLSANHIPAFIEGQHSPIPDPILDHPVMVYPIHVPEEHVSAAKEMLRRYGQFI